MYSGEGEMEEVGGEWVGGIGSECGAVLDLEEKVVVVVLAGYVCVLATTKSDEGA